MLVSCSLGAHAPLHDQVRDMGSRSNDSSANAISETVTADLRACGLRPTDARRVILAALRDTKEHPTVEMLRASLEAQGHHFGVATVYQNLNRLAEAGLVVRFLDDRGLLRFDANVSPHHHLHCTTCGRIADVEIDAGGMRHLWGVADGIAAEHRSWQLETAQLELRGMCPACHTPN